MSIKIASHKRHFSLKRTQTLRDDELCFASEIEINDNEKHRHKFLHFHFKKWEDWGVPKVSDMIKLIQLVDFHASPDSMLVHCNAR